MIWLKVKGDYLNMEQNLIIGGIYNSPINSSHSKHNHEDLFQQIQDKMLTFRENEYILIGGDFNARTGNIQDIIEGTEDENNLFSLPEYYTISQYKKLKSNQDIHTNAYGDKLIDMATSSNLIILNGRIIGDLEGKFTYVGYNGLSTVDYVLGSENLIMKNHIHSFVVEDLTLFSDHKPTCHSSVCSKQRIR